MKTEMLKSIAIAVLLIALTGLSGCATGGDAARTEEAAPPRRSFDMLTPYGDWLTIPLYGEVWRPHVESDWEPYTLGHWRATEDGWIWISYEPFGWVVYHYGSWLYEASLGWLWVPGYDWAPERVQWADYGDYVGWAPAPPPGGSLIDPARDPEFQTWVMVPAGRLTSENVGASRTRGTTIRKAVSSAQRSSRPPSTQAIADAEHSKLHPLTVETEQVSTGGRDLLKMKLPQDEELIVQSHARAAAERKSAAHSKDKNTPSSPADQGKNRAVDSESEKTIPQKAIEAGAQASPANAVSPSPQQGPLNVPAAQKRPPAEPAKNPPALNPTAKQADKDTVKTKEQPKDSDQPKKEKPDQIP